MSIIIDREKVSTQSVGTFSVAKRVKRLLESRGTEELSANYQEPDSNMTWHSSAVVS